MTGDELRKELAGFIGSTTYYPHFTGLIRYTDGILYIAQAAEAWWLIDIIAIAQPRANYDLALREFQLWELFANPDRTATLVCSRDTEDAVFRKRIQFTTFPMQYLSLYVERGVLLLPSEH